MTPPALREIEAERLRFQAELDMAAPPAERNRLGQFATPPPLARRIAAAALEHLPAGEPIRFLEPSLGTGAFYSALLDVAGRRALAAADGIEADPAIARIARGLWAERGLSVRAADFTAEPPPDSEDAHCNLLLANPPYVRHHHLRGPDKSRIRDAAERASGVRLSGLAGLYCYFILLAHRWLAPGAISAWLVPSEFFDVNYGAPLKQYLLERVSLLRLHRYLGRRCPIRRCPRLVRRPDFPQCAARRRPRGARLFRRRLGRTATRRGRPHRCAQASPEMDGAARRRR